MTPEFALPFEITSAAIGNLVELASKPIDEIVANVDQHFMSPPTAEEGANLLQSYSPSRVIPARAQFLLQEFFPEERSRERDTGLGR
jgi:hypothetical protein